MANTFTAINQTKVMSEVIGALKTGLTPMNVFSLSVGSDPMEKNEYVNVPLITGRSAGTNTTNYENTGNTTIVGKQVQLATNISCEWHITAPQASKTNTDAWQKQAVEATYAVASAAQLFAFDLILNATYSNKKQVAYTGFDADLLLDIQAQAVTLGWRFPAQNASVVVAPTYYSNLMKDPAIRDKSASGMDVAAQGQAQRAVGFNLYENAVILSQTEYTSQTFRGFACLPECMAVAVRPPAILGNGSYEVNEIISDPDTGISANYRSWVNTQTNVLWGAVEILIGGIAVDTARLIRIYST